MAWVIGNVAHIAWCGDSRAYLFNRQSGLSRLSNDHSYVQELVDTGKLDPELAFDHPNSNIITRSLGDSPTKAQPDYVCKGLSAGDYLILCSDGLCGIVRDEEILDVMMQEDASLEYYRTQLFNAAFNAGGYDNVTIALFECLSMKEEELTSTVTPMQIERKKTKSLSKLTITFIIIFLLLVLAAAALFYFGVISLDEGYKAIFDFTNLKFS
jgi:protein phosphatase